LGIEGFTIGILAISFRVKYERVCTADAFLLRNSCAEQRILFAKSVVIAIRVVIIKIKPRLTLITR
jgi:hypothetical protein